LNILTEKFREIFIDRRVGMPLRPTIESLKSGKTKLRHWGSNSTVRPLEGDAVGVRLFGLLEFSTSVGMVLFFIFFAGYVSLMIFQPTVDNKPTIYLAAGVLFGIMLPTMLIGTIYYARYGLAKMQVITSIPGYIAFPFLGYYFAPVSTIISALVYALISALLYVYVIKGRGEVIGE
ncbi:MAG: hypothetical protein KAT46_02960, partial [Deltaproteobacteria bacterium]|nr:hypothetical protein [Deltaproteobacteria bacterium]